MYQVYARPNNEGYVERFFSTCFKEVKDGDVFVKEGDGDEFVHVSYMQALDANGCHNYKIIDNKLIECTAEDKEAEMNSRPLPEPTLEEQVQQMQAGMAQIAMQTAKNTLLQGGNL
ncbi:hypothetical protein [Cellulosilyticum sp. I15G10I2]|uniref:hypothetical protein n=1 Tax=Cellulosilyticum sp. I15G10I2 TaxID=1892843 RepID=UPI00085C694B|nr:hypothetical protein [Cellulosilyticum sp. I15G10I2]